MSSSASLTHVRDESRALIGEKITSVEQIGHADYHAFFIRTEENPGGGWVTQDDPYLWAEACAVWAAIRSGQPFTALLFYENRDPNVPRFNNVERIYLVG